MMVLLALQTSKSLQMPSSRPPTTGRVVAGAGIGSIKRHSSKFKRGQRLARPETAERATGRSTALSARLPIWSFARAECHRRKEGARE